MRFTVASPARANNELALIWLQAPDRRAVSQASHEIDQLLRTSPLTVGHAHGSDYRLTVAPVTVIYKVSPDDCLVTVLRYLYTG